MDESSGEFERIGAADSDYGEQSRSGSGRSGHDGLGVHIPDLPVKTNPNDST